MHAYTHPNGKIYIGHVRKKKSPRKKTRVQKKNEKNSLAGRAFVTAAYIIREMLKMVSKLRYNLKVILLFFIFTCINIDARIHRHKRIHTYRTRKKKKCLVKNASAEKGKKEFRFIQWIIRVGIWCVATHIDNHNHFPEEINLLYLFYMHVYWNRIKCVSAS